MFYGHKHRSVNSPFHILTYKNSQSQKCRLSSPNSCIYCTNPSESSGLRTVSILTLGHFPASRTSPHRQSPHAVLASSSIPTSKSPTHRYSLNSQLSLAKQHQQDPNSIDLSVAFANNSKHQQIETHFMSAFLTTSSANSLSSVFCSCIDTFFLKPSLVPFPLVCNLVGEVKIAAEDLLASVLEGEHVKLLLYGMKTR